MYPRYLESFLTSLLTEFRIIYLTGPRQAGKTTLVRSIAQAFGMDYLTLDNPSIFQAVSNDPYGFLQSLGNKKIVLDEFQYVPELISAIKEASDHLPPEEKGRFILTGSADIFRSAQVQEALPGHMARLELYPLSLGEVNNQPLNRVDYLLRGQFKSEQTAFLSREQLAECVLNGGYPEVQDKGLRAKQIWFQSYMEGRLFKDFEILYAARGDYHSKLRALVPYLAGISGNLLKYASVSNDLGLDDKLIKAYIDILELMFIIKRVPTYLKNRAKRQVTGMPKLHMVDTGLASYFLGLYQPQDLLISPHYGGLLESLIYMELMKQAAWASEAVSIYHFRDKQKHEVDLVMERGNGQVIGIEVKASSTVKAEDFKNLVRFAEFAGDRFKSGIVFYGGRDILPFKQQQLNLYALPIGLFLGSTR